MTPAEECFNHWSTATMLAQNISPYSVSVPTVSFKRKSKITKATPANAKSQVFTAGLFTPVAAQYEAEILLTLSTKQTCLQIHSLSMMSDLLSFIKIPQQLQLHFLERCDRLHTNTARFITDLHVTTPWVSKVLLKTHTCISLNAESNCLKLILTKAPM